MPELDYTDGQDQSETFDEDNQNLDGEGAGSMDMKTLEEMPDVLDVTAAAGDDDDEDAIIGDDIDDEDAIRMSRDTDSMDIEDDPMRTRMPEAFDDDSLGVGDAEEVYHAEEVGLDNRESGEEPVSAGQPDLFDAGDLNEAGASAPRERASFESGRLDDEDIEDLGYAPRENRRGPSRAAAR